MSVARKTRAALVFLLVVGIVLAPVDFSALRQLSFASEYEIIETDTTWTSENGVISISNGLLVQAGVTLSIEKGTIVEFGDRAGMGIAGELRVNGTPEEPVIFRRQNPESEACGFSISARYDGKIIARNMEVRGGGCQYSAYLVHEPIRKVPSIMNTAMAVHIARGAFDARDGGSLDLEGVRFTDNAIAVLSDSPGKVWRSRFEGNEVDILASFSHTTAFDARYNWWGSASGPVVCELGCFNGEAYTDPVNGNVDVSDWATEADFRDPVVVIPGIMGSWRWTNSSELVLSPILGIYRGLIATLEEGGYAEDTDLFPFPYEWRFSNVETAELLHSRIEEIKAGRKWPKVDIIAHSMGGLVARQYVATHGSEGVDQLVTLGTPHNGSPKSYLTWEAGEFHGYSGSVLKYIFKQEAEKNEFGSILDYVRMGAIESVRELLPIYSYLRSTETGEMRTYPELYPRNLFLEQLSEPGAIVSLEPILFSNIVGKTLGDETIKEIRVGSPSISTIDEEYDGVAWEYGKPDGYDAIFGDRGKIYGPGDKTVPLSSATDIAADEMIEIESSHASLPSNAAERVYTVLTGDELPDDSPPGSGEMVYPYDSLFVVFVFSPIDIQVVAPDGSRVGKEFGTENGYVNEIDGAFYTGSDTNQEFITIPNPGDGEYAVLVEGTGSGEYRIEAAKIAENEEGEASESSVSFEGVVEEGSEEAMRIEIAGATVELADSDTTAPSISISSPEDGKAYRNMGMLPLEYEVSDDVSAPEDISVESRFDGETTEALEVDLAFLPLGAHEYAVIATDEADNESAAQAAFSLTTDLEAVTGNLDRYAELGLLGNGYEYRFMKRLLSMVKRNIELIEWIELSPFIRSSRKARWITFLETRNNRLLDILVRFTERSPHIDSETKDLLVEQIRFLRGS